MERANVGSERVSSKKEPNSQRPTPNAEVPICGKRKTNQAATDAKQWPGFQTRIEEGGLPT